MKKTRADRIILAIIAELEKRGWDLFEKETVHVELLATANFVLAELQSEDRYKNWAFELTRFGWQVDYSVPGSEPGWKDLMDAHRCALGKQRRAAGRKLMVLSKQDFLKFVSHIERPRKPNKALKDAIQKYRAKYGL